MLEQLVLVVIYIIIACIVAGLLVWLVKSAPFVPEQFKPVITWLIYAICVVAVILALLSLARGGRSITLGHAEPNPAIESYRTPSIIEKG